MNPLLAKIKSREDLVNMNLSEQSELCDAIRLFLVDSVSKTGGHLASNLGVVELAVALERNLDTAVDKLVWDVGHQAYVHKILTGRAEAFDKLRSMGGLSGFPKTSESVTDAFNTGHSSTSISAAYGMACSRDLLGQNHKVVAVIGDGALTGGMAYEALNDISDYKNQLLIIVNDNGMSISNNKGGLSKSLDKVRVSAGYQRAKIRVKTKLSKNAFGRFISRVISLTLTAIKRLFIKNQFFESLGLKYIGPIDGHDLDSLNYYIKNALNIQGPVVLHINTIKGLGYQFATEHPDKFHGIGPFDPESGELIKQPGESWSHAAIDCLCKQAEVNPRIVSIVAAMASGTGMNLFADMYPNRFFDAAIAEQHAVTLAAGMAISGLVPFVDIYSTFLQRAYDQILHDVCLQNLHVVFLVDRCGIVGEDGETHQGLFDYSFMRSMPNMTILEPYNRDTLEECIRYAACDATGPVAIRFSRGAVPTVVSPCASVNEALCIRAGSDIAICATGSAVVKAMSVADLLSEQGISAAVICPITICPVISDELLIKLNGFKHVATIEASCYETGFGQALKAYMADATLPVNVIAFAYPNKPIAHGNVSDVDKMYGMSPEAISQRILNEINAS